MCVVGTHPFWPRRIRRPVGELVHEYSGARRRVCVGKMICVTQNALVTDHFFEVSDETTTFIRRHPVGVLKYQRFSCCFGHIRKKLEYRLSEIAALDVHLLVQLEDFGEYVDQKAASCNAIGYGFAFHTSNFSNHNSVLKRRKLYIHVNQCWG